MKVEKIYSIEELYDKVQNYDIVFTSEAAMMSALNDRIEEPVLGYFAITPLIYCFREHQNDNLLQERRLFIEIVKNTDLSWKQASYLLENVLECWRNDGSLEAIKKYDRFDTDLVDSVIDVIENENSVFSVMEDLEVDEDKDVAVVNFDQFDEMDKQVLPENFERFDVFTDEKRDLDRFKVFNSSTEIVRTVVNNVTEDTAQDTAVVLKKDSSYSALIESALESEGIPVMRQDNLGEDEGLRTFIQTLRLATNNGRKLVKDCQPVLRRLGFDISIKKNNDYLSEVDIEEITDFQSLLSEVEGAEVSEALELLEEYIETDLTEEFEELGILQEKVSGKLVNQLEYYLDTFNIEKDSTGNGVLLANSNSSAVVDRPIVFYLGMDSSWTPGTSNRPWIDKEEEDTRNLKEFKMLIQNGEQQHYLVQDQNMNDDVTPCLYFNELTDEEFESFRDLPHESYEAASSDLRDGFNQEEYDIEVGQVSLFSQSSLNGFVKSPKEHLFDRVTDSADQDYFRKGTLYHDFAEFYANQGDFVEEKGVEEFIEIMLDEMKSIVDELKLERLETEFRVGIKNIKSFVDQNVENKTELEGYSQRERKENFFAEYYDKEIENEFTEAWFENPDLVAKGTVDLIVNDNYLADYKSGKNPDSAPQIVKSSNLELLEDSPNFQAMLYLANLRTLRPDQGLKFTFFHFLSNIEDEMSGEADPEENIVTISYFPDKFNESLSNQAVVDYIYSSNQRRDFIDIIGEEDFKSALDRINVNNDAQYDKHQILNKSIDEFKEVCRNNVEIGRGNDKLTEKQLNDGAESILKKIVEFRKKNYFEEDLDAFEDFLQKQLDLLNSYRSEEFPLQNPVLDQVDVEDLDHKDMIAR